MGEINNFEDIYHILEKCTHLEKIKKSNQLQVFEYCDLKHCITYTLDEQNEELTISTGYNTIVGRFKEKDYILKILRGIIQNWQDYEKNLFNNDQKIISLISKFPVKYPY